MTLLFSGLRSLRSLLVATGLLMAVASQASDRSDAVALVEQGKDLFKARDYPAAFGKFRAAAHLDHAHPTALYNAALAARKAGLLEEARDAYVELLSLHGDDLDVVYGLAETERTLAHYDQARVLYERFVREERRAERAELVEKSRTALAALPTEIAKSPTPSLERAAGSSVDAKTLAQALFEEGLALARRLRHDEAAARFLAAADTDPTRFDALLKAGVMLRKHNELELSKGAYERVLASAATPEQVLDATYGLAETERLRGQRARAIELFTRYADQEKRPSEDRYVRRARELVTLLRDAEAVAPVADPSVAVAEVAPPLPFFGDAVVVAQMVEQAQRAAAAGDEGSASTLWARARALSPDDPRIPVMAAGRCDVERQLAVGEVALSNRSPGEAIAAFRRARVCDPNRAAPLWGLSRAFDEVGAKTQAKHHAQLYTRSRAPDRDPASATKAAWRSEQPD